LAESPAGFSRRTFLTGAGAVGALGATGLVAGLSGCTDQHAKSAGAATQPAGDTSVVAFRGAHQAGITTPAQDRLAFAAFDVITKSRDELRSMLEVWTAAAEAMTQGKQVPGGASNPAAPPADTGEAVGLPASALTVTIGFGPSLFDDRFGLASRRPAALAALPRLPGDQLQPARSDGDLCIQACANDPQVAFHAVRNLARLGRGTVVMRWSQLGFGRTSSTDEEQATPRNLMGFKDGTRNIKSDESDVLDKNVWVGAHTDQAWIVGGSYLVARRIRMRIESWDRDFLADQENVFGRFKASGAPLTGSKEFDTPDFKKTDDGKPVIPADAHIRLASAENNGGIRILRRGYSYTDGIDAATGELDAGLFFIVFQNDPATHFVALQRKLGVQDALNEYISHTGSALFGCPPGLAAGETWADQLFA
jgi:deferrochelatase/peroxidase EfeB